MCSSDLGFLALSGLTKAEGLTLPRSVGGDLDLGGLTDTAGIRFPSSLCGCIVFNVALDITQLLKTQYLGCIRRA